VKAGAAPPGAREPQQVAGAAAQIEHARVGAKQPWTDSPGYAPAPEPIEAEGKQMVQQVVTRRNPCEHAPHPFGDLLRALELETERVGAAALLAGCDFCHPMLILARPKLRRAYLIEADALQLPLPPSSFDLLTVAFGFRNLANYRAGLAEMRRVLRPGGAAAILEFSRPTGRLLAPLYRWYATRMLPCIGGWISGHADAYRYLPESVHRFPTPEELASWMREEGFSRVAFESMSGGIVCLHVGVV